MKKALITGITGQDGSYLALIREEIYVEPITFQMILISGSRAFGLEIDVSRVLTNYYM